MITLKIGTSVKKMVVYVKMEDALIGMEDLNVTVLLATYKQGIRRVVQVSTGCSSECNLLVYIYINVF